MSGLKRATIYVCDDEPLALLILRRIFLRAGYDVRTFSDGSELVSAITEEGSPDLIVSDVMMPILDGFGLCSLLKSRPETAWIPIVLATSLSDVNTSIRAARAGADGYFVKPIDPAAICECVEDLLEKRAGAQVVSGPLHHTTPVSSPRDRADSLSAQLHADGNGDVVIIILPPGGKVEDVEAGPGVDVIIIVVEDLYSSLSGSLCSGSASVAAIGPCASPSLRLGAIRS